MSDPFFEHLEREFGDTFGPITDPGERYIVMARVIRLFNHIVENIEEPDFIKSHSDSDSKSREVFRFTIESLDKLFGRLLEGIEKPETEINPEEIDLGNFSNPEEPITDPIVRYVGFLALRSYIRFILELMAERQLFERLDYTNSAEYLERLRNTILSLALLTVRIWEGLEKTE